MWRKDHLPGGEVIRWADVLFYGAGKVIAGVIWILKPMQDGIAIDWPIRYKDMEPWYDYVETFAGISGSKEGLAHLPDGIFLPPMDLNCVEKDVAARIKAFYKGQRHMFIGRVANLTAAIPGRTKCQFRNRCWEGCPFGGYFSTQSSTLPAAMATGKLNGAALVHCYKNYLR